MGLGLKLLLEKWGKSTRVTRGLYGHSHGTITSSLSIIAIIPVSNNDMRSITTVVIITAITTITITTYYYCYDDVCHSWCYSYYHIEGLACLYSVPLALLPAYM